MILILVNIFDLNKKILYQKDIKNSNNNNHLGLNKNCLENILEILEVSEKIYLTISIVVIFIFV